MMMTNSDKQENSFFSPQKLSSPRDIAQLDMELTCVNEPAADSNPQIEVKKMTCYAENKDFEKVRYSFDIASSNDASD